MEAFSRRLPLWAWWIIGVAVIAAIAVAAVFAVKSSGPRLPPGLTEKRADAARILDEASRIEDVDLGPLTALEAKKDFRGAAALLDTALAVSERQERLNASLISVSEELSRLAVGVTPDTIGTKAVEAFGMLKQLAESERKFFTERRVLFEAARSYYADLAEKKKPAVPANFKALADGVNSAYAKVRELYQRFADAARAFDEAIRKR